MRDASSWCVRRKLKLYSSGTPVKSCVLAAHSLVRVAANQRVCGTRNKGKACDDKREVGEVVTVCQLDLVWLVAAGFESS